MIRIILRGCNGHMGRVITDIAANDPEAEIVAGIDLTGQQGTVYPVYRDLASVNEEADVLIDFSSPKELTELLADAKARKLPLVLCSTGYTPEQLEEIGEAAKEQTLFRSANMSLGVSVVTRLIQSAAAVLMKEGFDAEIVERHHRRKLDAPSGTALALAEALQEVLDEEYACVFDRSGRREQRPVREIGISAVRGGTIVGEHEIIFAGRDEVIEIKHTAYSREIFAKGAVVAAKFLAGKEPGLYSMKDVI
ncbi:MAG: 4-hydroxy-tetrahydrodipicolinate reductase [Lachnospiraceae bacterium]|nr:4-hydroxy-tetrahydrodipicolinate reductase [Lachnospiraceae bacterium]